MNAQHTPGPWKAIRGQTIFSITAEHESMTVATLGFDPTAQEDIRQVQSNANLLAAAPELLEACKAALRYGLEEPMPNGRFACDMMAIAIAKAEGRNP